MHDLLPDGALSNRMVINVEVSKKPVREQPSALGQTVEPRELLEHPLFKDISLPFLMWNRNAIVRRTYRRGDVVCREGEFGATAYIVESGKFDVRINASKEVRCRAAVRRHRELVYPRGSRVRIRTLRDGRSRGRFAP